MQFTDIKELDKFIRYSHCNNPVQQTIELQYEKQDVKNTLATQFITVAQTCNKEMQDIMKQIDLFAMSMMQPPPSDDFNVVEELASSRGKAQTEFRNSSNSFLSEDDGQPLFVKKDFTVRGGALGRRSIMWRASTVQSPYLKKQSKVKVFYFGKPISKFIKYTKQTTLEDVIDRALISYLEDPCLDKGRIRTLKKNAYILRVLDEQTSCKPDMDIQPLDPRRKVSEVIFQNLVLIQNTSVQVEFDKKQEEVIQNSPLRANMIMIRVYDEYGCDLFYHSINKTQKVNALIPLILKTNRYIMGKFYLTQTKQDELEIDEDSAISSLDSKKLFVKIRKFADEPVEQKPKAKKQVEQPQKQKVLEQTYNLVTLQSASNYQEFNVLKVNRWGKRQKRILGIDQTKIYNYDPDTREGQVSIFSKLMGKSQAGTRRPQRFIKDITNIKQIPQKNLIVISCKDEEQSKDLELEADHPTRYRIMQKIGFLLKYHRKDSIH